MAGFSFYDNDAFYFVPAGEPLKVYQKLRQEAALWQAYQLTEAGLVVNNNFHQKVFIKNSGEKLLTVFSSGYGAYRCRLGDKNHTDRAAIADGKEKIESMTEIPACPEFAGQSDDDIERQIQVDLELAERQIQVDLELAERQRKLDSLSLADYHCENDFEAMVKQDISEKLQFLADYDEDCIHSFISAILNRQEFKLPNDGDFQSRVMRTEWLMNYDYISLKLDAFPDQMIFDYQQCVVKLLKQSFPFEGPTALVDSPTASVLKTARQYTFDKLFEDFHPEDDLDLRTTLITSKIEGVIEAFFKIFPANPENVDFLDQQLQLKFGEGYNETAKEALRRFVIPALNTAAIIAPTIQNEDARDVFFNESFQDFNPVDDEYRAIFIASKITDVRKNFFERFPQNEANIAWLLEALDRKFGRDFPEDQRNALFTNLSQERLKYQLLESLASFSQFYQVSNCPQYLAQWMWNVVSYVYRICAWLDTYCLKLGQGNVLMKQFSDSLQNHGFFQDSLGLNQTDGFDKVFSAHVRQIILG